MIPLSHIPNITQWMMQSLFVTEADISSLCDHFIPIKLPKRSMIVKEGSMCGCAFFIERGMTRSFWMVEGEEVTTSFSTEGHMVFSMDELYFSNPSEEYIETVEDVLLYQISIRDFLSHVRTNINLANWWAYIHQCEYRRLHQSHKERLTLNAAERYRAFSMQFPEVCRRGRLSDIASYLGVTQSTLSRIRSGKYTF